MQYDLFQFNVETCTAQGCKSKFITCKLLITNSVANDTYFLDPLEI